MATNTCEDDSEDYADIGKDGLLDVKFFLDSASGDASLEEALEENERFDGAIAKNNGKLFDFGDLRWAKS